MAWPWVQKRLFYAATAHLALAAVVASAFMFANLASFENLRGIRTDHGVLVTAPARAAECPAIGKTKDRSFSPQLQRLPYTAMPADLLSAGTNIPRWAFRLSAVSAAQTKKSSLLVRLLI
jgi:hypothetical protein